MALRVKSLVMRIRRSSWLLAQRIRLERRIDLFKRRTAAASEIDQLGRHLGYEFTASTNVARGLQCLRQHLLSLLPLLGSIEDRKLAATNKLVLDQLTFGERVESPTATKLPVLLAVSLLKDRNGVINLDLPIEGTLDDPKFSVWGIIGTWAHLLINPLDAARDAAALPARQSDHLGPGGR